MRAVGYLPGAHSVVRLIAETARWQTSTPAKTRITAIADDGFYVECGVRHPLVSVGSRAADYNSVFKVLLLVCPQLVSPNCQRLQP